MEWIKNMSITGGAAFGAALILSVLLGFVLLPILRHFKLGQPIKAEALAWHKTKEGTPTMGGLSFVTAFLLCTAGYAVFLGVKGRGRELIPFALVVLFAVGNSAIGFIDDYCKLIRKSNDGLSALQKLLLQLVLTGAFIAMMRATGNLETAMRLPFADDKWIELSWFAYPVYLIVITGFINATNLTDGIDGLASSVCAVECAFIVLYCFIKGDTDVCVLSAALLGCMIGFLVFNHNPAQMFMGDTGSLFLGGVLMGCAVMTGELLLFLLAGFVFVIDMLTSLLQTASYKLRHKRIFPIAPIHHSFERWGWSENQIVALFAGVTLLLCVAAYFGI